MDKPVVFMFSGQGSQYYMMGKSLFDRHPVFHKWMCHLDTIVQQTAGYSVLEELYRKVDSQHQVFDQILFTHPAIFMVEYSLSQVLIDSGVYPYFVIGTSLGEFAAAAVSGIVTVEEALFSLIEQAKLFHTKCLHGSMLAILYDCKLYDQSPWLNKRSELVSINYDSHFVVSGTQGDIRHIKRRLNEMNILAEILPVSYAFHSSLIDEIEQDYQQFLSRFTYHKPKFEFVSSLVGEAISELPKNYFWDVIRKPILFNKVINELEQYFGCTYVDVGPSGALANFTKRTIDAHSQSTCHTILSPFGQDLDNLNKLIGKER
ncbi:acyltransferase domain-containing protein [Bacillus paralicheniformis]|uniref:acyltransferase domain-containing protein n=1 Tax=Bacillus paralicheniformis TaxID=1648923 RepID=UPI001F3824A0|nr:acyltransferase domain-containing protein [Bacillus paralicheniformis]